MSEPDTFASYHDWYQAGEPGPCEKTYTTRCGACAFNAGYLAGQRSRGGEVEQAKRDGAREAQQMCADHIRKIGTTVASEMGCEYVAEDLQDLKYIPGSGEGGS